MLIGAIRDPDHADMAISDLEKAGYSAEELSVIAQEKIREGRDHVDAAMEGAAEGATTGTVVGGLAGLLVGAGLFPGLAGLLIGGPIVAALGLTGMAATTAAGAITGALAGGLIGALVKLGVPEATAEAYNEIVEEGGVVIGVPLGSDDGANPRDILERHGAESIEEVVTKEESPA